jgi:hypothetical protein
MALTRWEPFSGLTSLRRDMDRLFENFLGRGPFQQGEAEPAIVVKAQVPGVSRVH